MARRVVMVASGAAKSAAMKAAFEGPISSNVPASFLQTQPSVEIIVDEDLWGALLE